jgi:hypothetical protein
MSSSSNSIDFLKSFSEQLGKFGKTKSEIPYTYSELEEELPLGRRYLTKSISVKSSYKKDQNFKVVVRVRPPLEREIDAHSGFAPITHISKNNK